MTRGVEKNSLYKTAKAHTLRQKLIRYHKKINFCSMKGTMGKVYT